MDLNIPAIHGVGSSRIYFVDRYRDFSIYDVDFTLIPTVDPRPPALAGMRWFGIVQYIGSDRMEDWTETSATASCPRGASCAVRIAASSCS
jgi:4-hydroxyphenylpyruvate dioxygenase